MKNRLIRTPVDKSNLKLGNNNALLGGAFWTVPELMFESTKLIPAIQDRPVYLICITGNRSSLASGRLVIKGMYGENWVKWLRQIDVK